MATKKLNEKQERFCTEYLIDLNATQAAIRAGYSKKTAYSQGHDLLKKPEVQTFLAELNSERFERVQVSADDVLRILYEDVTADVADLYADDGSLRPVSEWPMVFRRGLVAGIDVDELTVDNARLGQITKIKLADRTRLKELLGKHTAVGAFKDQLDIGGAITVEKVERVIVRSPKADS